MVRSRCVHVRALGLFALSLSLTLRPAPAQNCDVGGSPATASILSSPLSVYSCRGQIDVWRNGIDQVYYSDAGPFLYINTGTPMLVGFTGTAGPAAPTTWTFVGSTQLSPTSYRDALTYTIPGRGPVDVTQTISYTPGNDFFTIQVAATNNSLTSIADFRILYGADAFVNGDDASDYGDEDWAMTRTVGVRDDTPSPLFTGFSGINHIGDASVAQMTYYTDAWFTNWTQVLTGALPSTINLIPMDQGISMAFHKNGPLAQAETWTLTVETVFDFPSIVLGVNCNVTAPAAGATVGGNVDMVFDGDSFTATPLTTSFSFSTNGGLTFAPMTAAPGSPLSNPDPLRATPFSGATYRWNTAADGVGLAGPQLVDMRASATDGVSNSVCSVSVIVDNQPQCAITAPLAGAMVSGDIPITWSGSDPGGSALTSTLEFSTSGGLTWAPATAAPGSPASNPDLGRASPFAGVTFLWDAAADGVGTAGPQPVDFRIRTVSGGGGAGRCSVGMLLVDNVPTCRITAPPPGGTYSADVAITYDGLDPSGDPITSTFQFSLDGGLTWAAATAAPGSPTLNPDPPRATPFIGRVFLWDTAADGLALETGVMFRIAVDDGSGGASTCGFLLNVDNEPSCAMTSPAGGAVVSGNQTIQFNSASATGNQLTAGFELSTDGGTTFVPATDAGTGTLTGNPTAPFTAGASDWTWASTADLPTTGAGVILRVTVCDVVVMACSSCSVIVDVDNLPTCIITAPPAGSTGRGTVSVSFNGFSPGALALTSTFDWSDDGGATWQSATAAAGSPTMNPDLARPAPFGGVTFDWDSAADGVGTAAIAAVDFRITVAGAGGAQSTCQVAIDVDNTALCNLCGDCNLSGTGPDVLDSLTAAQIAVALIVAPAPQRACCDVDTDGDVDVVDALFIAQAAAGLPVVLVCV